MFNIQENISLAPMTSFRIGGQARFFIEINSVEELEKALRFAKEKNVSFCVIGSGTNMLVNDKGFDGLIIKMKMNKIDVQGATLEAEAGVPLIKAVNTAALAGLSGIESMAGIPGTVGGAVRGNAGAFGSEMGANVVSVKAFDLGKSAMIVFEKNDCQFAYRSSIFKNNKNLIILSVLLELAVGDQKVIQQKVTDTIMKRTSSGLHGFKSAGSYFMNPIVSNEKLLEEFAQENGAPSKNGRLPAGWVIDRAGLRGKKIGGAMVNEKHANYIINTDDATAEDVIMLVSYIKQQVRDQFGIELQEEVNYVGF